MRYSRFLCRELHFIDISYDRELFVSDISQTSAGVSVFHYFAAQYPGDATRASVEIPMAPVGDISQIRDGRYIFGRVGIVGY